MWAKRDVKETYLSSVGILQFWFEKKKQKYSNFP